MTGQQMTKEDLMQLENASADDRLGGALQALTSDNRNVRVLALRILGTVGANDALSEDQAERAATGICTALNDTKRRVRKVALQSCVPYLKSPEVVRRLREMVEDVSETRKLRGGAVAALSSASAMGPAGAKALGEILEIPAMRLHALIWLAQVEMTDQVSELLEEFVDTGTREEAIMATRVLCGYRMVNLGSIDPSQRRTFARSARLAYGRAWYWVKRDTAAR